MQTTVVSRLVMGALGTAALLQWATAVHADAPVYASAKSSKATHSDCGVRQFLVPMGDASPALPPSSPGCTSSDETYIYLIVAKTLLRSWGTGGVDGSSVYAGYTQ